jgi:D-lyxose ketol-isomerase
MHRIHVRQNQVTHMHRLNVYQNTVLKRKGNIITLLHDRMSPNRNISEY